MNAAERQYLTRAMHALSAAGWMPYAVDDGGDRPEKASTVDAAIALANEVDSAVILLRRGNLSSALSIVAQGPDGRGDEIVCDYGERLSPVLDGFV